jgi:MOSC domain-containing protein YiiM
MVQVDSVRAVAGKGLEGDRYANGAGTYSGQPGTGRQVTLIEAEAIESLAREYDVELDPAESRRNIVTRGLPLNHLVGREFRVGEVTLRGMRLCEPCGHLEKLTRPGVRRGLVHRGGLRADIVDGGVIHVADAATTEARSDR